MRNDFNISDAQFKKETEQFYNMIESYVQNEIMYDYIAFYLANKYLQKCMWTNTLSAHINSAIDCLCNVKICNIDKVELSKINNTLIRDYQLEIVSTNPLQIKKVLSSHSLLKTV